jgi:AraC-like DNA-binding protein
MAGRLAGKTRSDGVFSVAHPEPVRFLGLRIPSAALAPLTPGLDDRLMNPISRDTPALGLLTAYPAAAVEQPALEPRELVVRHVHELVAAILGAPETGGGIRAARLRAIQADILASLDDPELGVSSIAARHRVTPRYVHKLFELCGATFYEFVLERRLERVRRLLDDPGSDARSISALAFSAGFGDLSYFNRTFRRRFGATPSEIRRRRGGER